MRKHPIDSFFASFVSYSFGYLILAASYSFSQLIQPITMALTQQPTTSSPVPLMALGSVEISK